MDDSDLYLRKRDDLPGIPANSKISAESYSTVVDELLPALAITTTSSSSLSRPSLLVLPNEVLDHVFAFLGSEPPSARNLVQLPSRDWTISHQVPLKALSTTSHHIRAIVLHRLFRHSRLDPCQLTPFLEFINRSDLARSIESIVAHISALQDCFHPAWYVRLLNEVPLTRLVVGCEPHLFAGITGIRMDLTDRWAFDIPYQYLEVRQSASEAIRQSSYDYLPGLLGIKHWSSVTVNEGSSLAAYTSYQHFLKKPPSLFSNVHICLSSIPLNATPEGLRELFPETSTQITLVQEMLQNLRDFSFVAVFPFYNHVDDILKCIRRMRNLESLFIKLCPEAGSTVLDDGLRAAGSHIDLNDPWNE